jgi:hypothetical protein
MRRAIFAVLAFTAMIFSTAEPKADEQHGAAPVSQATVMRPESSDPKTDGLNPRAHTNFSVHGLSAGSIAFPDTPKSQPTPQGQDTIRRPN